MALKEDDASSIIFIISIRFPPNAGQRNVHGDNNMIVVTSIQCRVHGQYFMLHNKPIDYWQVTNISTTYYFSSQLLLCFCFIICCYASRYRQLFIISCQELSKYDDLFSENLGIPFAFILKFYVFFNVFYFRVSGRYLHLPTVTHPSSYPLKVFMNYILCFEWRNLVRNPFKQSNLKQLL